MVFKQRFAEGRTHYINIGYNFTYVQINAGDFDEKLKRHFKNEELAKGCIGLIEYGAETEPVFDCYPSWLYSDDGKLFMTLNSLP